MPISTARFVLARGRSASAPGTLAVGKSAPSEGGWDCDACFPGDRVVFFDTSMLSEAPSGATPACAAAELVSVGGDPDRAFETRRRGARWRSRAGLFASPVSTFAPFFVCLRGCLLAIAFVLWMRIAHRDACTTTSPARGARRVATQEGAVDTDSNASRAGEVERNVRRDNDFLSWRRALLRHYSWSCSARAQSGVCRFRDGLARAAVLPQLKVDRLCSVVGGTADFDPEPTSDTVAVSDRSWAARSDFSPLISQLRPPMGEDE
jgi:hypothetical protein